MYKYKFLNILDTLSYKEFKTFGKFVNSSYFNESLKIKEFYEFIKEYYHEHSFGKVTPELISGRFYGSGKSNELRTRKLISDFGILLDDFLVYNSFKENSSEKKDILLNQYKTKELTSLFNYEFSEKKKVMNVLVRDGKDYYESRIKIINEEIHLKKTEFDSEKKKENLLKLMDNTDKHYIFSKLYSYHLVIQNNLLGDDNLEENWFMKTEDFIENLANNEVFYENNEPIIFLYYLTVKLIFTGKKDDIYSDIEYFIEKNRKSLSLNDIEFCVRTLINYLINDLCSGKNEKVESVIKILKKIEDKRYLDNMKDLKYFVFIQIITFALDIKEIEFAEAFLWKYFSKVKTYKEESVNIALASLRFEQGRFSEAKDYIDRVNLKTFIFYVMAKGILLKIYYEENSLKFINPMVDSFKHYLKRNNEIPDYIKYRFNVFLNYIMRLSSLKKKSRKDLFKIEYGLSNEKNIYSKLWIEEKLFALSQEI